MNMHFYVVDIPEHSDEVGFIHPSQFVTLNKEASSSLEHEDSNFWSRDHKLAISTDVLLPLYKAAKDAFMHAISQYKRHGNLSDASGYVGNLEIEAMKHSKALLLLSCDFGTAWNFRYFQFSALSNLYRHVCVCLCISIHLIIPTLAYSYHEPVTMMLVPLICHAGS